MVSFDLNFARFLITQWNSNVQQPTFSAFTHIFPISWLLMLSKDSPATFSSDGTFQFDILLIKNNQIGWSTNLNCVALAFKGSADRDRHDLVVCGLVVNRPIRSTVLLKKVFEDQRSESSDRLISGLTLPKINKLNDLLILTPPLFIWNLVWMSQK